MVHPGGHVKDLFGKSFSRSQRASAALRRDRASVAFADVQTAMLPALRHRLILSFEGQAEGVAPDDVLREVLAAVPQGEDAQA